MFNSCEKEEVSATTSAINGEWNLTMYSAGLAGSEMYNKDDVTWTFKANNTVDVLVNIVLSPNTYMPIQSNTTVNYSINGTEVTVNGEVYDFYYENSKLIISDKPELDGPRIQFERD